MVSKGDYVWVDRETTTEPHGTVQVIRDHWWLTNDEGQVCFYRWRGGRSPQCNTSEKFTREIVERTPGATGVEKIPLAFERHYCERY